MFNIQYNVQSFGSYLCKSDHQLTNQTQMAISKALLLMWISR